MELPVNEAERLACLLRYGILDTEHEECFDRLTRMAAVAFEAPVALLSLVDANRQWFKSAVGLEAKETPREISFCTHAILGREVMVVPDAPVDPRFRDNPLVTGAPFIRFYAGAPLVTNDDLALGTLCIIDRQARSPLSDRDARLLKELAAMAVDELEARRERRDMQRLRRDAKTCITSLLPAARSLQQARNAEGIALAESLLTRL
ncbi:Diguanylate cyclase (modular protein) [Magnetospirillum sp. LM-5]|uniref:GAF domain-containing protein n=1 Tax=Magnetospirillum sp. LM-5 TaxID=2681466 RepID=UPI0013833CE4|nr:GAF domain-containing protein [Magnetospirillum sp. LM-5]CAA7615308.1 Diguanylate cyclase (modular protein) [Magnetospirillum sp. LM-5]